MLKEIQATIALIGKPLTLRVLSQGTYSAENGLTGTDTDDYSFTGVITNYSDRSRDGSLILANDRKILLAGGDSDVAPTVQDQIIDGVKTYTVISVQQVEDSGVVVAYICQVRV